MSLKKNFLLWIALLRGLPVLWWTCLLPGCVLFCFSALLSSNRFQCIERNIYDHGLVRRSLSMCTKLNTTLRVLISLRWLSSSTQDSATWQASLLHLSASYSVVLPDHSYPSENTGCRSRTHSSLPEGLEAWGNSSLGGLLSTPSLISFFISRTSRLPFLPKRNWKIS